MRTQAPLAAYTPMQKTTKADTNNLRSARPRALIPAAKSTPRKASKTNISSPRILGAHETSHLRDGYLQTRAHAPVGFLSSNLGEADGCGSPCFSCDNRIAAQEAAVRE